MRKKQMLIQRIPALLLALALLLGCAGCGLLRATTMSLTGSEGDVNIWDGNGKGMNPRENMKLYSGYEVETAKESYAWINLDDVKLVKMDVKSEIEIQKDGNDLEIVLQKGSLFFNVTEPLADEESMTIRTSTMAVGIRGTCGWVDASDKGSVKVYILEGRVRCKGSGVESVYVDAGEMAQLESEGEIEVRELTGADIPDFVMAELTEDGEILWQGHRYQVFTENMTWKEADEYCRSLGGRLASITSPTEQALITRMVEEQELWFFWLGGTDEAEEGTWVWTDGEEWAYSNWGRYEPNNDYGGEHYAGFLNRDTSYGYRFQWNDFNNEGSRESLSNFGFICEWVEED